MANKKSIIPEFMKDNPDDIYQFLFPLKIVLDEDQFGNSHYEVVVKNINTNQFFSYLMSPELLFTHYQFLEYYKNHMGNFLIKVKHHMGNIKHHMGNKSSSSYYKMGFFCVRNS